MIIFQISIDDEDTNANSDDHHHGSNDFIHRFSFQFLLKMAL